MNRLVKRLHKSQAEWVMFTQFVAADLQKGTRFPSGIEV
jgi:hypothetical protein